MPLHLCFQEGYGGGYGYKPFGAGPCICIGMHLAMIEIHQEQQRILPPRKPTRFYARQPPTPLGNQSPREPAQETALYPA